nr:uncharacterized protein LOC109173053 [Ipomoea batatas]
MEITTLTDRYVKVTIHSDDEGVSFLSSVPTPPVVNEMTGILVGCFLTDKPIRFDAMQATATKLVRRRRPGETSRERETTEMCSYNGKNLHNRKYPSTLLLLPLIDSVLEQIGNFLGIFLKLDGNKFQSSWRRFYRVRVELDVAKPLRKSKKLTKRDAEEKQFGPWLRAPSRRPSPVTGNRWVVLDDSNHNTTTTLNRQGQDVAADTGAAPGQVRTDVHCTSAHRDQHVATSFCLHPTTNGPVRDATMEQMDPSSVDDGLTIVDSKPFGLRIFGSGKLTVEISCLIVGPRLMVWTLLTELVVVAKLYGFGANTSLEISRADLIFGTGE